MKREGQDPEYVRQAFARVADRYVLTNHVLSGGLDVLWRWRVGRQVASWSPQRILDVASGTGDLALELQRRLPEAEIVATDFSPEMLEHAARRGVARTQVADALSLPFETGSFEVVTVAFGLRNMANWREALREMGRVLQPGGRVVVLDFSLPEGRWRAPYRWYLHRVLPRVAGCLTGEGEAYRYLGGSIEEFPSGEKMAALMEEAGLVFEQQQRLTGGVVSLYVGRLDEPGEVLEEVRGKVKKS